MVSNIHYSAGVKGLTAAHISIALLEKDDHYRVALQNNTMTDATINISEGAFKSSIGFK
jgi:hypothetical protein